MELSSGAKIRKLARLSCCKTVMDCCNYVQPYAQTGSHYYHQQPQYHHQHNQMLMHHHQTHQQQHGYPYEPAYYPTQYGNCRMPAVYPSNDYVYNPKEARIRKAMREQSRSSNGSSNSPSSLSSGILGTRPHQQQQQHQQQQHQHQQQQQHQQQHHQQQHQGISSLPGGGSGSGSNGPVNRINGPWFPLAQPSSQPKPILSPRVMAAHQRTLDKTKDVIRKQLECNNSTNYPAYHQQHHHHHNSSSGILSGISNSGSHDYMSSHQDRTDYCTLNDGQKWHPYQNGVNAYHSRSALMSKMNTLHRGMQNTTSHPTSPWGQFCNVPFSTSQNAIMRSNRHMVFLQEQQNQHCSYGSDEMQMSYESKMQDDLARRLHSSPYSPDDQQAKSSLTSLHLSQKMHDDVKCNGSNSSNLNNNNNNNNIIEDGPRWGTPRPSSVSSSSCTTDTLLERESQEQSHSQQSQQCQQRSKQPLPGFQQAFGSTEIGKFSRSELFASLVEAATNVSSSRSDNESSSPEPLAGSSSSSSYNGYSESVVAATVNTVVTQQPRWHSPYAGAIGSEI